MKKYAICPICQARIFPGKSDVTPREELENHLHNEEARTWVQARQLARDSTIILEDAMATKYLH
jgi:hypothetical protein